jgi:hypothetical protein
MTCRLAGTPSRLPCSSSRRRLFAPSWFDGIRAPPDQSVPADGRGRPSGPLLLLSLGGFQLTQQLLEVVAAAQGVEVGVLPQVGGVLVALGDGLPQRFQGAVGVGLRQFLAPGLG